MREKKKVKHEFTYLKYVDQSIGFLQSVTLSLLRHNALFYIFYVSQWVVNQ